jgi:HPt (histidine-containing phosphotransfer) domain-containing protein
MANQTRARLSATPTQTEPQDGVHTLAVWDIRRLVAAVGDNPQIHRKLLGKFQVSARELVGTMGEAVAAQRWKDAGAVAHKLKSSARAVGALRLGEWCHRLERAGFELDGATCTSLIALLEPAFAEADASITTWMNAGNNPD